MDSVSGNGDGFLLHLNVVDLVIVVEDDLLFSRCSALTVQHDGRILRGDPLNTVVGQVKEHRVPGHAGVLLGIPVLDVLLHIGLGVKLDHIHVALDAQAVSLRRVAAVQQAGGDGLMALGGAVHLEVPQENLQSVIRGGDSADLDGGNTVLDVHIARLSYLVAVGNPLVGDAVGVDLRGAYGDVLGIGAAHLLVCHHIHKLDGDGDGDRLIDGGQLHIAFGDTKEIRSLSIGEAIQGLRGQLHTIISHPVRELLILRGGDFGDSPDDLVAAGVGNISRLRIIEAIRPGALTVVELQGDGLNGVDFLVVGCFVSVLILRPHGVQGGVFRNGKCTRHEGHRIFGGLSRNQVGPSLAPTQEHCLFLCQTAALLNCNSAAVQILIRILHGPASTIRIISNGKLLIFVIRNSVSVCIRSPDSVQSDIACNGQYGADGYKLRICCSFFGLDQVGFSFAPAKESSVILCETAAILDRNLCILTIGVAVCYNTFAAIRIVSDLITGNVNNSAVYIYRTGCAIGFCIGQGCALIG